MTHTFDSEVSLHYWLLWPMVWRSSFWSPFMPLRTFSLPTRWKTLGCAKVSSGPMDNLEKVEICPHLILAVRFVACRFDVLFPDTGDSSVDSFKYVAKDATGHSH